MATSSVAAAAGSTLIGGAGVAAVGTVVVGRTRCSGSSLGAGAISPAGTSATASSRCTAPEAHLGARTRGRRSRTRASPTWSAIRLTMQHDSAAAERAASSTQGAHVAVVALHEDARDAHPRGRGRRARRRRSCFPRQRSGGKRGRRAARGPHRRASRASPERCSTMRRPAHSRRGAGRGFGDDPAPHVAQAPAATTTRLALEMAAHEEQRAPGARGRAGDPRGGVEAGGGDRGDRRRHVRPAVDRRRARTSREARDADPSAPASRTARARPRRPAPPRRRCRASPVFTHRW